MSFPRETEPIEVACGIDFNDAEEKIVAHLFKMCAEMTGEQK